MRVVSSRNRFGNNRSSWSIGRYFGREQLKTDFYLCHPIQDRFQGNIDSVDDATVMGDKDIQLALTLYEKNNSVESARLALAAVQQLKGKRVIFLVDNVDLHGKDHVYRIARTFSKALDADSIVMIAVRPYHAVATETRVRRSSRGGSSRA